MLEGRGQKVIVVDNDRTILELLEIRLDVLGYHAYVVRNGSAALDLLKHVRPAAMILDLRLVETDGFEVLRIIRLRHADQHFPILVTGRNLTAEDVQRALSCGAQNCMTKPYSGTEAVERIGRLIEAAHRPPPGPEHLVRSTVYL